MSIKIRGFVKGREKKRANRTSHRYNRLPLLPSDPGGVQQELVVPICRGEYTITNSDMARNGIKKFKLKAKSKKLKAADRVKLLMDRRFPLK
jgi:hypothetical protein